MPLNFQNAFIGLVEDNTVFADPATLAVPAKIRAIGIGKAGQGYKISEEQKERDSIGDDRVFTYKLEVDVKFFSKLAAATKTAIEAGKTSLIFLDPTQWVITDSELLANEVLAAENLLVAQNAVYYRILRPVKLTIEEDNKFGEGKVNEITIKGSFVDASKDNLHKVKEA